MKRVLIIGSGGAGKSTLARHLGELTGLPVVHLDREHWQPGWVETPRDEWTRKVAELVAPDEWIIDGNYGGTMGLRIERADTIVFLDYSRWLCMYRSTKRQVVYRNKTRPDMTPGCDEKLDPKFFKFLKWIWQYRSTRRPGVLAMLRAARADGKRVVVLKDPKATRRFLARVLADGALSTR